MLDQRWERKHKPKFPFGFVGVGPASCERSHRRSGCFRGPYEVAVNKSTGTNTSIHHDVPRLLLLSSRHLKQTDAHFSARFLLFSLAELQSKM